MFSYRNTVMVHLSASLNCLRQLSILRTSKNVAVVLGKDLSQGENNIWIQLLPWFCPIKKLDKSLVMCTLLSIHIEAFKEKAMAPHSSTLAWKITWQRSLVGCSPWGREESDTTERLHFLFSRSCVGEGNGNPLQCSCLENPRDGGAWRAAVYGVAQSRTRLKRLSSSSSKGI